MNTIQEKWERFEKLVVPKNAPAIQREEMRKAFYCGAEAMSEIQYEVGGCKTEEAAIQILNGVQDEFRRFAKELK